MLYLIVDIMMLCDNVIIMAMEDMSEVVRQEDQAVEAVLKAQDESSLEGDLDDLAKKT